MTQTMLLAFARAVGLVSRAPAFSHPSVPPVVRAGFALALAFAVAPHVAAARALDLVAFTLALAGEFAVGAAIGFGASLLYDGAYYGGRTIDDYLGVRGSVPGANVTSAQAFGRLWSSAFLMAFVLLDGWVPVVRAFAGSFDHVAAGAFGGDAAWTRFALALPATIVRAAFARRGARGRRRGVAAARAGRRRARRAALLQLHARLSGHVRRGGARDDRNAAARRARRRPSLAGAAMVSAGGAVLPW